MYKENFINVENKYKKEILKIWKAYSKEDIFNELNKEYRKSPLLPRYVQKNSILFIGMNPSFPKGASLPLDETEIGFYDVNFNSTKIDLPYFEKMKEIANYCRFNASHIDLLFLRETNQKIIEKLSYTSIEFLKEQLFISWEIITEAMPKVIVVSNALASEFFGKKKESKHKLLDKIWLGNDFYFVNNIWNKEPNFNNQIGTYEIEIKNKKTPILFCGMLSGQRALDIGSFERLKWQIKFILNSKI